MFIIGIIIMAVGVFLLYQNREKHEELLILKLVGYYILGIFYFNLNPKLLNLLREETM